ncbi:MAG: hypothetical protein M1827_004555 [Pycnora praestabilis]|nr:MAG: hypothetical protein M1827_004555 [Pycnora praestabilis]
MLVRISLIVVLALFVLIACTGTPTQTITVDAENNVFIPDVIHAAKGTNVEFKLTTGRKKHIMEIIDTQPIYFFSASKGACEAGMQGVINPPKHEVSLPAYSRTLDARKKPKPSGYDNLRHIGVEACIYGSQSFNPNHIDYASNGTLVEFDVVQCGYVFIVQSDIRHPCEPSPGGFNFTLTSTGRQSFYRLLINDSSSFAFYMEDMFLMKRSLMFRDQCMFGVVNRPYNHSWPAENPMIPECEYYHTCGDKYLFASGNNRSQDPGHGRPHPPASENIDDGKDLDERSVAIERSIDGPGNSDSVHPHPSSNGPDRSAAVHLNPPTYERITGNEDSKDLDERGRSSSTDSEEEEASSSSSGSPNSEGEEEGSGSSGSSGSSGPSGSSGSGSRLGSGSGSISMNPALMGGNTETELENAAAKAGELGDLCNALYRIGVVLIGGIILFL